MVVELPNFDILHKGRLHHAQERAKDHSLPALIAGSGRVSVSGHVEFLAVDGSIVSYWPEIMAHFTRVPTLSPAEVVALMGAAKHNVVNITDIAAQ